MYLVRLRGLIGVKGNKIVKGYFVIDEVYCMYYF